MTNKRPTTPKDRFIVDSNTKELPFRIYSERHQCNVAYFHTEADAIEFAAVRNALECATEPVPWAEQKDKAERCVTMLREALAKVGVA